MEVEVEREPRNRSNHAAPSAIASTEAYELPAGASWSLKCPCSHQSAALVELRVNRW